MSNQDIIITVDSFTCPACASVVSFDFDDTITCPGCENVWVFVGNGSISEVKEIYESLRLRFRRPLYGGVDAGR